MRKLITLLMLLMVPASLVADMLYWRMPTHFTNGTMIEYRPMLYVIWQLAPGATTGSAKEEAVPIKVDFILPGDRIEFDTNGEFGCFAAEAWDAYQSPAMGSPWGTKEPQCVEPPPPPPSYDCTSCHS